MKIKEINNAIVMNWAHVINWPIALYKNNKNNLPYYGNRVQLFLLLSKVATLLFFHSTKRKYDAKCEFWTDNLVYEFWTDNLKLIIFGEFGVFRHFFGQVKKVFFKSKSISRILSLCLNFKSKCSNFDINK